MIIIFNFVSSLYPSFFFCFNQSLINIIVIFLIFRTRGRDKLPSKFQFPLRSQFSLNLRMCQRRKSTVNYPRCCFSTTNGSNPVLWRRLIHHVTGYPSAPLVATVATVPFHPLPISPELLQMKLSVWVKGDERQWRTRRCLRADALLYNHYCYHNNYFFQR